MFKVLFGAALFAALLAASTADAASTYFRSPGLISSTPFPVSTTAVTIASVSVPAGEWEIHTSATVKNNANQYDNVDCGIQINGATVTAADLNSGTGAGYTPFGSMTSQWVFKSTAASTNIALVCSQEYAEASVSIESGSLLVTSAPHTAAYFNWQNSRVTLDGSGYNQVTYLSLPAGTYALTGRVTGVPATGLVDCRLIDSNNVYLAQSSGATTMTTGGLFLQGVVTLTAATTIYEVCFGQGGTATGSLLAWPAGKLK